MQLCQQMSRQTQKCSGQPSTESKKSGRRGSVVFVGRDCSIGLFQESPQRISLLRENGKLGPNHIVKFSNGHNASRRKIGKRRVHRGDKWEPQERVPLVPKFEHPQSSLKDFFQLKEGSQDTFYSLSSIRCRRWSLYADVQQRT